MMKMWTEILQNVNGILNELYLHFQRAFDTVPHEEMLTKIEGYVVEVTDLHWLRDSLADEEHQAVLNGDSSI